MHVTLKDVFIHPKYVDDKDNFIISNKSHNNVWKRFRDRQPKVQL